MCKIEHEAIWEVMQQRAVVTLGGKCGCGERDLSKLKLVHPENKLSLPWDKFWDEVPNCIVVCDQCEGKRTR